MAEFRGVLRALEEDLRRTPVGNLATIAEREELARHIAFLRTVVRAGDDHLAGRSVIRGNARPDLDVRRAAPGNEPKPALVQSEALREIGAGHRGVGRRRRG